MIQSSGSSSFSYREGNPLIQFEIGAEDLYLLSHTLRLNFQLDLIDGGGNTPTTTINPQLVVHVMFYLTIA